jgi:hypothetical protein
VCRAIWIDPPNDPDPLRLKAEQITDPIFDARWLAAKGSSDAPTYLGLWRGRLAGIVGIYICGQGDGWKPSSSTAPQPWADWAYDLVQVKVAPGTSGSFPSVDLNVETANPQWMDAMLRRWRSHSHRRATAWSMPANKAPYYASLVPLLVSLNIVVKPQCYAGETRDAQGNTILERVESAHELATWEDAGMPRSMIQPVLDAAQLGLWWGVPYGATAFTQGRLP